ncbi:glycosyltransferase family 4 protein [Mycetocola miduiensis]|nr:glycosyltransferase family 4 protein [Mycetocola miduiensis]
MKKMYKSVWIVNHYISDPRDTASGSRHFSLAAGLARLGWAVSLIAASAGHNTDLQRVGKNERSLTTEHLGVTFRWLRTSTYKGNGVGRVLGMLQFSIALLRKRSVAGLATPDVIVGSTVHPLAAWAASVMARRYGVPFVFEIRDLWPQTLIDMGKLRSGGLPAYLMRILERHLCKSAETIIVLMPFAADYLAGQGVSRDKVVWISNGTDVDAFPPSEPPTSLPFTFMYFGAHGGANGLEAIVQGYAMFRDSSDQESRLMLIGDGPRRGALRELAASLECRDELVFVDAVPKSEIPRIAGEAHCLVLNLLDLELYKYGISLNKLFDYMAASRPIIIASNAANNPVRDAGGGVTVPANDPSAIAKAMQTVVEASHEQRVDWGTGARRHVSEYFDYARLSEDLDGALNAVVERPHISSPARSNE